MLPQFYSHVLLQHRPWSEQISCYFLFIVLTNSAYQYTCVRTSPPTPVTWAVSSSCFLFSSSVSTSLCLVKRSSLFSTSALSSACKSESITVIKKVKKARVHFLRPPVIIVPTLPEAFLVPLAHPGGGCFHWMPARSHALSTHYL